MVTTKVNIARGTHLKPGFEKDSVLNMFLFLLNMFSSPLGGQKLGFACIYKQFLAPAASEGSGGRQEASGASKSMILLVYTSKSKLLASQR